MPFTFSQSDFALLSFESDNLSTMWFNPIISCHDYFVVRKLAERKLFGIF